MILRGRGAAIDLKFYKMMKWDTRKACPNILDEYSNYGTAFDPWRKVRYCGLFISLKT